MPGLDGQDRLFDPGASVTLTLADRFLVPPFSVLDSRAGYWQERKGKWLELGIQSELGREGNLLNMSETVLSQWGEGAESAEKRTRRQGLEAQIAASKGIEAPELPVAGLGRKGDNAFFGGGAVKGYGGEGKQAWGGGGTSVFDPVLCELMYRWYAPEGGLILDPFAGGSVRGIVAAHLGRRYVGIDLRPEQCESNERQAAFIGAQHGWQYPPRWICGDSLEELREFPEQADFIFSCPPYADLEVYSGDARDLSAKAQQSYAEFKTAYETIVGLSVLLLKPDRFAAFVVGEVRDKRTGTYRGFVPDTIRAFEQAGAAFYNEAILVTSVGSLPIRTSRLFKPGRKLGKTHQNLLGFVKGDWRKAAEACPMPDNFAVEYGGVAWVAEAKPEELFDTGMED